MTPHQEDYPIVREGRRFVDRIGNIFGRLTILGLNRYNKHNQAMWLCRCECGGQVIVPWHNLRWGGTRSCGCLLQEVRRSPKGPQRWRQIGNGVAARNVVVRLYMNGAARRNLSWGLTDKDLEALFKGCCHYCGCDPWQISQSSHYSGNYVYNGIDRLDNSKGYEDGNVVSCCKVCNLCKGQMSELQFYAWLDKVHANLSKDKRLPIVGGSPCFCLLDGSDEPNRCKKQTNGAGYERVPAI